MYSEVIVQTKIRHPHKSYIPPEIEIEEIQDEGIMAGSPIQVEPGGSDEGDGDDDPMSKQGIFIYDFSVDSEDYDY